MNVGSITPGMLPVGEGTGLSEAAQTVAVPTTGHVPFSTVMNQFLQQVDGQQQIVSQGVNDLIAGKTDNIHEIAISVAQADIAFRMVMEVRDKLVTAYQEVMRMQV